MPPIVSLWRLVGKLTCSKLWWKEIIQVQKPANHQASLHGPGSCWTSKSQTLQISWQHHLLALVKVLPSVATSVWKFHPKVWERSPKLKLRRLGNFTPSKLWCHHQGSESRAYWEKITSLRLWLKSLPNVKLRSGGGKAKDSRLLVDGSSSPEKCWLSLKMNI